MSIGGIAIAASVLTNLVRLFVVYSTVDTCLENSAGCSMDAVFLAGRISLVVGVAGAVTLISGLLVALISSQKR